MFDIRFRGYFLPSGGAPFEALGTDELDVLRGDLDDQEVREDLIRMEYMDARGEPTQLGKEAMQVWSNYPRREDRDE